MKIKQLKEKTAQGLKDFLPKIGVGDIEGLLDTLNDKLSKSQGGEINKPIVITNNNSNYSITINPDGSIFIYNKYYSRNIFNIRPYNENATDVIIDGNRHNASLFIDDIIKLISKRGEIYNSNDIFTASKFKLRNGNNKQVLLGDGSTTNLLLEDVDFEVEEDSLVFTFRRVANNDIIGIEISGATNTSAGVMTAYDKAKLDNIPNIYAEKSKTISNIAVNNLNNKRGLYMLVDYADRTNPGTTVNIPNATSTTDGCMSYEDKKTLDAVKTTYLPLSGGKMTGTLNIDFENGIQIVENDNNPRNTYINNGSIRIESLYGDTNEVVSKTEINSNSITTPNAIITNEVKANGFSANNNGNGNTVWTTNGGSIDLIYLLSNAAIYVAGSFALAEGGINANTVIDNPDSIIFDVTVLGGRFLAKKGLVCYTHWKADISKNIAPPSRYGIETDNGVFPFNNQMYRFAINDYTYIATCSNGTCTMKKLTLK